MIHIICFDMDKVPVEQAVKIHQQVSEAMSDEDDVIIMPLGLSWIPDCPLTELKNFRDYLSAFIERMELRQINDL